jgi:hypothetical protein
MTKIIETHTGIFNKDGEFIINTENKYFLGQCLGGLRLGGLL